MMAKKVMIVLLVVALALIAVHTVSAGPGGGFGRWDCPRYQTDRGPNAIVSEKELAMRKDLLDRNWELRTELRKDAPDKNRVDELRKNIFDLREKLAAERFDKGFRGPGYGRGYGDCPYYGYGRWEGCRRW